ncbi:UDP-3-O-[3-hydroxymyristoyl] N-acetylglucosamine deacetylase [candidate division WOR-1 bacterium RIFOXYB2_FULL_48_7]|uniref:UDP-3-O-acyl-N-acetylglucosamine deacetylase n=1 Tax=candidate division WOR-1 bacterium RIFOXYB2_FULL_48_7 TaxID=1802583 RepID=A0A1F4TXJ3_UNCSA|nr:MAG: UDP-3-O-[3-hydroxymyristoyl] N-acetylglucosamine deacetylase [candidate division WOR-1 bacterium RIFOXYB2_FULL_48_7]
MTPQQTIKTSIQLSGIGIHSGQPVSLIIVPAKEGHGIVFEKDRHRIPATINQLVATERGSTLKGLAVVEHLLSAVAGLGIDNLLVKVAGDELPILDGSARDYVAALLKAGLVQQTAPKKYFILKKPLVAGPLEARPYDGFRVHFVVNFPVIGEQSLTFDPKTQDYATEIAPARTFGYLEEYEALKTRGLALGASLDNALVLDKNGYVNQPRFSDELVRHKILDLIGDLALLGRPVQAEIFADKSGHQANAELARRILQA